ncbi:ribonuclease HII [Candidatus Chlamydia sanziniae]|uniref:Ribonuclease HII n=1 Tax=Candidatus Chlamydia sanziniae TaxID=1806891 RepID=A0A1A9HXY2_9CHLA|nr:ribonuclease HII [Candidatus Chlamydia sanziniae]ANH78904.1 Ribonuclease HII [Candidatus Chlamydia sanziniae]
MNVPIDENEIRHFFSMTVFEREVTTQGFDIIAGVDEVGRGPLAGPVVAAACVLPKNKIFVGLNDSKKLTSKQRATVCKALISDPEVSYGIGEVSVERIDAINILEATKEAMIQAIVALSVSPNFLLVDGLDLFLKLPSKKIIGGDAKSASIAAASILAKEYRDNLMRELHTLYPHYGFDKHKGYGTARHLAALRTYGPCICHRKSFSPIKQMCVIL